MKTLLALCIAVWSWPVMATPPSFQAGVHYQLIEPRPPLTTAAGRVEVIELFWYGCQTCFAIQPELTRWLQQHQAQVSVLRVPALTEPQMLPLAQAYYVAAELGILGRVHERLYNAVHRQQRPLRDMADVARLFAEYGVDARRFNTTLHGRAVGEKIRQARLLGQRLRIRGAPTLIIDGRYRLDASMVGNAREMMAVLDYLVRQAQTPAR
ncbi:MAG: thiol:disulfide interchange protein DsbA/DsbL [Gammaproteobacteria bacterium]|nr:thiol:disulfide interchange protein DsbA/DsbL [Gammaproteobacteria bacterium]